MGVIMAVGMAAGTVSAVGQAQEGAAQSRMYSDAAINTDYQADAVRKTAAQNVMLTKQNMEQNVQATQLDASMQDKNLKEGVTKILGAQKAASAASGVGGGSVTQADIEQDTMDKAKMDEIAIRYNADAQSANIINAANQQAWNINNDATNQIWALGVQKSQYEAAAKNVKRAANIKALGTILSTASSTASTGITMGSSIKMPTNKTTTPRVNGGGVW